MALVDDLKAQALLASSASPITGGLDRTPRPGVVARTPSFQGFTNIGDVLKSRTPQALDILRTGTEGALEQSELARLAGTQPLEQFAGLEAFGEQQALLGTQGEAAQEAAIGNIPVSQFDRELQDRQRKTQLRQASARGERGSGATLLEAQQLAGSQQANFIAKRLAELEPLVSISRGVRSGLSETDEAARTRQAQLQTGLGTQLASVRLGGTAPLIESRLNEAELSGLRGIGRADTRGQIAGQLATLAGQFTPPPDPFFTKEFGFDFKGDPFAAGVQ